MSAYISDRKTNIQTSRRTKDRATDGQADRQMDERTDERTSTRTQLKHFCCYCWRRIFIFYRVGDPLNCCTLSYPTNRV